MIAMPKARGSRRSRRRPTGKGLTEEERRQYAGIPPEVDYVPHPVFSSPQFEARCFGEQADTIRLPIWRQYPQEPDEMPDARAPRATLSAADEAKLFLRYNYARFRLCKIVKALRKRKTVGRIRQAIRWHQRAMRARADLVEANMPLVLAMARRTNVANVELGELISEGNMALLRSVEKFDVRRGFKFSTYACRAILKSFARLGRKTERYRKLFGAEYVPEMDPDNHDVMKGEIRRRESIESMREILDRNRACLTRVEQLVLTERFALASRGKGRTLAGVGRIVGLTNERVRQIQKAALVKIRLALEEYAPVA